MTDSDGDKSCWIPRGEPIVTPARLAKDDLSFRFSDSDKTLEIQLTIKNILNYLYDEKIITERNWNDGYIFEAWQAQHQVAMGLKKAVSTVVENSTLDKLRAHGFILLIRKLTRNEINIIEFAINAFATSHNRFIVQNRILMYRRAFERLSDSLTYVKDKIYALEALNEDERSCLCENNLRKYLVSLKENGYSHS